MLARLFTETGVVRDIDIFWPAVIEIIAEAENQIPDDEQTRKQSRHLDIVSRVSSSGRRSWLAFRVLTSNG